MNTEKYYGLATASPYVGMARFKDGGSNQCISVFRDSNIIAGKPTLTSKTTQSSL